MSSLPQLLRPKRVPQMPLPRHRWFCCNSTVRRGPQSQQSVPLRQKLNSAPGPPSSQTPLKAYPPLPEHVFWQTPATFGLEQTGRSWTWACVAGQLVSIIRHMPQPVPASQAGAIRGPQSVQSLPKAQLANSAPGPPSWHWPSEAKEHSFKHRVLVEPQGGPAGGGGEGGLLGGVKRMICAFVMPNVMTAETTNMLLRRIFFCAPLVLPSKKRTRTKLLSGTSKLPIKAFRGISPNPHLCDKDSQPSFIHVTFTLNLPSRQDAPHHSAQVPWRHSVEERGGRRT